MKKVKIIEALMWMLNDRDCIKQDKLPAWAKDTIKELIEEIKK